MNYIYPPFRVGVPVPFFGVDGNQFKIDSIVYEAIEDPDDGYRSYLDTVEVVDADLSIFFMSPLDIVQVREMNGGDEAGWELVSCTDGHVWLQFGTDHYSSYYPYFFFNYYPRLPKEAP